MHIYSNALKKYWLYPHFLLFITYFFNHQEEDENLKRKKQSLLLKREIILRCLMVLCYLSKWCQVYSAFIKHKKSPQWCAARFLDFKALNRAVNIRNQLEKFIRRHSIVRQSGCNDTNALRKCLLTGYFSHAARLLPDGSYRSLLGDTVFKFW